MPTDNVLQWNSATKPGSELSMFDQKQTVVVKKAGDIGTMHELLRELGFAIVWELESEQMVPGEMCEYVLAEGAVAPPGADDCAVLIGKGTP